MEHRPFTLPELPLRQRFMRALPYVVAWVVLAPLVAIVSIPHLGAWTALVEMAFLLLLVVLHSRSGLITTSQLLMSPCPECVKTPMRFDRSSQGDYAFLCDR